MRLRPAPAPTHPARWLLAVVAVLASMFGAGSAVVPVAGQHGMGAASQLRSAPLASTRSSSPAPARAARSLPGGRIAGRNARGAGQVQAGAERRDRTGQVEQPAGTVPRSAASARLPRLAWPLGRRLPSAVPRVPTGLPAGRAPPFSAGT